MTASRLDLPVSDMGPRVVRVIVDTTSRGDGSSPDTPFRRVYRLHTLDGVLLAEFDPAVDSELRDPEPGIGTSAIAGLIR